MNPERPVTALGELMDLWWRNEGKGFPELIAEDLDEWLAGGLSVEELRGAIREAGIAGVRDWRYVRKVVARMRSAPARGRGGEGATEGPESVAGWAVLYGSELTRVKGELSRANPRLNWAELERQAEARLGTFEEWLASRFANPEITVNSEAVTAFAEGRLL
jgi:hypothetical protein